MANRDRYSRWALAGGVLALTGAADYFILGTIGLSALERAAQVFHPLGIPVEFARWAVVGASLAGGPACILLGKLGLREIRRHPGLRGQLLAQIVVIAGWLGTFLSIGAFMLIAALVYFGWDA